MAITVIDSIMGTGKTSWAIDYMNAHPEQHFVFITPFLAECERIIKNCSGFVEPEREKEIKRNYKKESEKIQQNKSASFKSSD